MPAYQYLDIPNIGTALGKFGGGLLDEVGTKIKQSGEEDALQQILSEFTEDMTPEEKASKIYGAKNVPFEQKQKVVNSISDLNKASKENALNKVKEESNKKTHKSLLNAGVSPEVADMYIGATEGGKTAILNHIMDEDPQLFKKMENGINQVVNPEFQPEKEEPLVNEDGELLPPSEQPISRTREGQEEPLQDFDKDLSRKEKVKRQDQRYSMQTPLVGAVQTKIHNLEADARNFERLDVLNEKMTEEGEWKDVFYINPFSGELISPAMATPEQQEWVKILSEFQSRAKESYGSRVTNFDLQAFMKRFPSLANTAEGRAQIIKQIKIVNKMDQLYNKEIDNVFDKYGVRNIDMDKAQRIAKKNIKKETDALLKEFTAYEHSAEKSEKAVIKDYKKRTPEGSVAVQRPDGKRGHIPKSKAKAYSKKPGWKIL